MVTVAVRAATASDMAAITAIYTHHVLTGTATFEIEPPDEAEMTRRWRACVTRGWPWLVACDDGAVAGYAYASQFRDRAAYAATAETSIYLDTSRTGQGIGRILLDALLAEAEAAGFRELVAVIGDSGNTASIRLHAACGFRRAGVLTGVGRKFGRLLDVVCMQRGPGTAEDTASF